MAPKKRARLARGGITKKSVIDEPNVKDCNIEMAPKKRARLARGANTNKSVIDEPNVKDDSEEIPPKSTTRKMKDSSSKESRTLEKTEEVDKQPKPQYCHWLMKSEPESRFENGIDVKFGVEDLKALPNHTGCWDGVRNYQARNFMRDMKEGQLAFFYHSNCKEPGIAGIMIIVKEAYVDHTQFDKKDVHFDAASKQSNPKWSMVDVRYQRMTARFISLAELKKYHLQHKANGGPLKDMALFTRARLSVQPLTNEEFNFVLSLEDKDPL